MWYNVKDIDVNILFWILILYFIYINLHKGEFNVAEKTENMGMLYKGKHLLRKDNVIYYGDMSDKYVAMLTIKESELKDGINMATNVFVQIMSTDTNVPPDKLIIKYTEKPGLYPALEIADIWLTRFN